MCVPYDTVETLKACFGEPWLGFFFFIPGGACFIITLVIRRYVCGEVWRGDVVVVGMGMVVVVVVGTMMGMVVVEGWW